MIPRHVLENLSPSEQPFFWSLPRTEPLSTARLFGSARKISQSITDLPGFEPGAHVALRLPAGFEAAASILGCWFARAVPASINPVALEDEVAHCTDLVSPCAVLHCDKTPFPDRVLPELPRLDARELTESPDTSSPLSLDPALDAIVLFTSGSTGRPKGVRLTHTGLAHSVSGLTAAVKPRGEVFLLQVPMHHVFGVVTFLLALSTGSRIVSLPDFGADSVLEAIDRHRVTIGFGPAEMFHAMAQNPRFDRFDVSSLKRLLLGGSPCREAQILEIENKFGLESVLFSFGMTETTGGISAAPFRDPNGRTAIHAGRLVETIEVAAFEQARPLPTGEIGELKFRGPHLMAGYVGGADLGPDEWFPSGDLGYIDEDRRLHVTGRVKNVIIKAGENISIAEVENALSFCPGVKDVCVVGIPDERLGENIAAAIATDDPSLKKRDVQKACLGRLLKSRIPQKILFVDALPRLANGKTDRVAVRALFADNQ